MFCVTGTDASPSARVMYEKFETGIGKLAASRAGVTIRIEKMNKRVVV